MVKNKVIYYTKSGNTEKLAKAIGEELSCDVATIDIPINESVEDIQGVKFFANTVTLKECEDK